MSDYQNNGQNNNKNKGYNKFKDFYLIVVVGLSITLFLAIIYIVHLSTQRFDTTIEVQKIYNSNQYTWNQIKKIKNILDGKNTL